MRQCVRGLELGIMYGLREHLRRRAILDERTNGSADGRPDEGPDAADAQPDEKPDLSTAPPPRFDLLDVPAYHALTIQFARGCPFNCEFCDIIVVYGRRPRTKTVDQMMAEVRECHRLGASQVFIVDDNFIGNKNLAK